MLIEVKFYDRKRNLEHHALIEVDEKTAVVAKNCESSTGCEADGRFIVKVVSK